MPRKKPKGTASGATSRDEHPRLIHNITFPELRVLEVRIEDDETKTILQSENLNLCVSRGVICNDQVHHNITWLTAPALPCTQFVWDAPHASTYAVSYTLTPPTTTSPVVLGTDWFPCPPGSSVTLSTTGSFTLSNIVTDDTSTSISISVSIPTVPLATVVDTTLPAPAPRHLILGTLDRPRPGTYLPIFIDPVALSTTSTTAERRNYTPTELVTWWYDTCTQSSSVTRDKRTAEASVDFAVRDEKLGTCARRAWFDARLGEWTVRGMEA